MDIRQLKCFAMVADLENFTLASKRLNLAQSALSRYVSNLEAETGLQLFVRSGRGVKLTTAGRRVRSRIEPLLAEFNVVTQELCPRERGVVAGQVCVGILGSIANVIVPELLQRIAKNFPELDLNVSEGHTKQLESALLDGTIDVALAPMFRTPPGLVAEVIGSDHLVAAGCADLLRDWEDEIAFADALSLPLILPTTGLERELIEAAAKEHGISLRIQRASDAFAFELAMARAGQGVLLVSRTASKALSEDHAIRILPVVGLGITWALFEQESRRLKPAVTAIHRIIREVMLVHLSGLDMQDTERGRDLTLEEN